jgi:signal transduction histidine kinase
MSEIKSRGRSAFTPARSWALHIPMEVVRVADEAIRNSVVRGAFGKQVLVLLRGGGIRRRLLMWGLSLFGIALTVVVIASYSYSVKQIERDAAELQTEIASVTADRIHNFVRRKIERFSDTAAAVSLYPLGSKEQQLLIRLLVKNDSSFSDASILDAQGVEVVKVSDRRVYFPSDFSDQSKSIKFSKAINGADYISRVYTSDKAQPYITIAIPLWGGAQNIVGVVTAEADLSFLWEVIEKIHFGTAGYGYLVDENGNLIAHKDASLALKKMNLRQAGAVQRFLATPARSDPTPAQEGQGLTHRPVLAAYAPVPELGWAVILEEPIDAALANVQILKRYAAVLLVIGLLVGAVVIAWVSSRMTGPIRELHQGAKIIGSGNLDYRVNIETGDEIEWLGEQFNKMAGELKVFYATLEQKVKDKTGELEKTNSQLEQANHSLVKANKGKDEFLSVMSHELKTPLNVIMGYAELARTDTSGVIGLKPEAAVNKILIHAKDLLHMVDEILQATRIEAGAARAVVEDVELTPFLEDLRISCDNPMPKELRLLWNYQNNLPSTRTDRDKLKHILQNLISNAIKFTPEGCITFSARYFTDQAIVEFKVADTGIGIAKELLPSIFERFRQLDASNTRSYGGVGLGLFIVKRFAEMLGGTITVESEPDMGSTFTLALPVVSTAQHHHGSQGEQHSATPGARN